MGNTISDLLYYDNPKRRKRAEGLRQDILQYVQDFEREKARKAEVFKQAKEKLDEVLKKLGVNTRDELDAYIRNHMKDDADLKAYDELRKSIDKQDEAANLIVDIAGLAGTGATILGGVAALVGVVSFATAMSAAGVVAGLAAAAALAVVIFSIYEGAVQREKLREAIHTMLQKRTEAFQCVQRLRILNSWAQSLVHDLDKGKTFEDLADLLKEGLKEPWDSCTLQYCREKLHEMDVQSGAWMNEDGGYSYYSQVVEPGDTDGAVPRVELTFTPSDTGIAQSVALILHGTISSTVCVATSGEDSWFIEGRAVEDIPGLENQQYDLECIQKGKTGEHSIYRDCTLEVGKISFN